MRQFSPHEESSPLPESPREAIRVLSQRLRGMTTSQGGHPPAAPAVGGLDQGDLARVLNLVRHASQALQQMDEQKREAEARLALLSERATAELREMDARLLAAESRLPEAEARARAAEERALEAEARALAAEREAGEAKAWLARFRDAIMDAFAAHESLT